MATTRRKKKRPTSGPSAPQHLTMLLTERGDAIRAALVAAARQGVSQRQACALAGIGYSTFCRWSARADEEPYKSLFEDIERARAELQQDLLETIAEIAKGLRGAKASDQLAAAKWMLRVKFNEDFGDHRSEPVVEVNIGQVQPALTTDQARVMTDEQIDNALAELRQLVAQGPQPSQRRAEVIDAEDLEH